MVDQEIEGQLSRARELRRELEAECEPGKLAAAEMHSRALTLFAEVLEKLRAILDRAAFDIFEAKVFPKLAPAEAQDVRVSFPIADDDYGFRAQLRRSNLLRLEQESPETFKALRACQPFASPDNRWLATLRDLPAQGKQEPSATRVKTVGPTRSTITTSVTFGQYGAAKGVPADLRNRNIDTPSSFISKKETLLSSTNRMEFVTEAIDKVEKLARTLLNSL